MTTRVLIAEDSMSIREVLVSTFESDPAFEVVGVAENGRVAIELCARLRPDVITMDMMMPVLDGLAATEHLMANQPTPILIVSASVNRGELFKTYDALAAGAVDVFEKPLGTEPAGEWERGFLSAVRIVARIKVITHPRGRTDGAMLLVGDRSPRPIARTRPGASRSMPPLVGTSELIAVGASTGGPGALAEVLRTLPAACDVPIAFVLHIGGPFGLAFAEWLEGRVGRPVKYAVDGRAVTSAAGEIVMAPPDSHLIVRNGTFRLTDAAERNSCRPSIDVLFESVAAEYGASAVGCLLTGMGRDGAAGLLAMHEAGASTVAQDEATSAVYGMPREAALLGAAQHVLPLDQIGAKLARLAHGRGAGVA